MRIKRGVLHLKHRRNILKSAKGYHWGRKNKIKLAKVAITKAGVYAYRDRRARKREFRQLWQLRINAAARAEGLTYSRLMFGLRKRKIELDRKILALLASNHPVIFKAVAAQAK